MVGAADDDAVPGVGAADLVPGHDVRVRREPVPEDFELARIVLRIAVGIRDEVLGRGGEAGAKRTPIAAVPRMMDRAHMRIGACQLVRDRTRRVGTAVVDDNDLEIWRQPRRGLHGANDEARDGSAVVVGRENMLTPGGRLPSGTFMKSPKS